MRHWESEPNDGHKHERDWLAPTRCWRCGKTMKIAMSGGSRK